MHRLSTGEHAWLSTHLLLGRAKSMIIASTNSIKGTNAHINGYSYVAAVLLPYRSPPHSSEPNGRLCALARFPPVRALSFLPPGIFRRCKRETRSTPDRRPSFWSCALPYGRGRQ